MRTLEKYVNNFHSEKLFAGDVYEYSLSRFLSCFNCSVNHLTYTPTLTPLPFPPSPVPIVSPYLFSAVYALLSLFSFSLTGTSCVKNCSIQYYRRFIGIKCDFSEVQDASSNDTGVQLVFTINGERETVNAIREVAIAGFSPSRTLYV